jgi:GT2 family glycosyltransferase
VLAVRRDRFLELGGFDDLYLPGRFEDLDLAFRGWLAGWRAYFVPDALAYHKGSATFGPRLGRGIPELDARNALLFAWKNLREPRHVAMHVAFLILRVLRALATGRHAFLRGLAGAAARLPEVIRRRAIAPPRVRRERELFDLLETAESAKQNSTVPLL